MVKSVGSEDLSKVLAKKTLSHGMGAPAATEASDGSNSGGSGAGACARYLDTGRGLRAIERAIFPGTRLLHSTEQVYTVLIVTSQWFSH